MSLLLRIPGVARALAWLAGAPPVTSADLERRILDLADQLVADGGSALNALIAAEAIEIGKTAGDAQVRRLFWDEDTRLVYCVYEVGPDSHLQLPLPNSSQAFREAIASLN